MKENYTLAFIPVNQANEIIKLAQHYAQIADQYILSENSIPHITLTHFQAEECELQCIWDEMSKVISIPILSVTFEKLSLIQTEKSCWISLLPNEDQVLKTIYHQVIGKFKNPLAPVLGYYDPHLTLCNSHFLPKKENLSVSISDEFALSIGRIDEIGQLISVVNLNRPSLSKKTFCKGEELSFIYLNNKSKSSLVN